MRATTSSTRVDTGAQQILPGHLVIRRRRQHRARPGQLVQRHPAAAVRAHQQYRQPHRQPVDRLHRRRVAPGTAARTGPDELRVQPDATDLATGVGAMSPPSTSSPPDTATIGAKNGNAGGGPHGAVEHDRPCRSPTARPSDPLERHRRHRSRRRPRCRRFRAPQGTTPVSNSSTWIDVTRSRRRWASPSCRAP